MSAYAEPKMIRGSRMKRRARKIADAARLRENSMRGLQSARMMRSRTRPSEATSKKAQRSRSAHNIQKNLVRQLNQPPVCPRSEEHTSELQSLMRISYAATCLKKKHIQHNTKP